LVDADPAYLVVNRQGLEQKGYEVLTATDGGSALELAARSAPDLIVLAMVLQGIDGLAVLEALRAQERTRATPVIVLSSTTERRLVQRSRELGRWTTYPNSPSPPIRRRYLPPCPPGSVLVVFRRPPNREKGDSKDEQYAANNAGVTTDRGVDRRGFPRLVRVVPMLPERIAPRRQEGARRRKSTAPAQASGQWVTAPRVRCGTSATMKATPLAPPRPAPYSGLLQLDQIDHPQGYDGWNSARVRD
jgi:CheY-like chemotaxis protein